MTTHKMFELFKCAECSQLWPLSGMALGERICYLCAKRLAEERKSNIVDENATLIERVEALEKALKKSKEREARR